MTRLNSTLKYTIFLAEPRLKLGALRLRRSPLPPSLPRRFVSGNL